MTTRLRGRGARRLPFASAVSALTLIAAVGALPVRAADSAFTSEGRCGAHPWCDTSLTPSARASLLEAAMSQSDKIAMLTAGAASDVDVPALQATDGAVGVRTTGTPTTPGTAFPAAIALAANFDQTAAKTYGTSVGTEEKAHGQDGDDGPTVNLMRTPLGGRTYEAYGEDPYLAGQDAVGWVDGLQSTGVMALLKHFIANDQEGQLGVSPLAGAEGGRVDTNVTVDDRTLHELDMRPFQAAIAQAKPAGVMCSYNEVGGLYACDSPAVLQTDLRNQLGFTGIILSDLGAAKTPQADLNAGMDWDIGGNSDNAALVNAALADGEVSQATFDARVHEYLQTLFTYGFFDRAAYVSDPSPTEPVASQTADIATEEGGATLLKNDGVLPLTGTHQKIAVIGAPAQDYVFGFGSSQVTGYSNKVTVLQGIQARAAQAGDTVTYDDGTHVAQAEADAKAADVAVVVAADSETEGSDKQCMSLTPSCAPTEISTITPDDPTQEQAAWGDQDTLITDVAAAQKNTIGLLETGAPVLTPWRDQLAGLIEAWYPGEDGGTAVAHVLFGDVDATGRLPVTFPDTADQEPTAGSAATYPGVVSPAVTSTDAPPAVYQETYTEGIYAGYRWFDQHNLTPAYPFGYGLSYTTFALSDLHASRDAVTVTVTNTGSRAGTAVPEVYLQLPSTTAVPEPPSQLGGFTKLALAPGASQTVTVPLEARDFQYWDTAAQAWQTVPGCPTLHVGTSSRDLPLSVDLCAASAGTAGTAATVATPTTNVAKTTKGSAVRKAAPRHGVGRSAVAAPAGTLAYTGADAAIPSGGVLLLILAAGLGRRRRTSRHLQV